MKKFVCLLSFVAILSSCVLNRTYIRDYGEQIRLVRENFPEIYDMYCDGLIIIDDVYTYDKDGTERVGVSYRYRE